MKPEIANTKSNFSKNFDAVKSLTLVSNKLKKMRKWLLENQWDLSSSLLQRNPKPKQTYNYQSIPKSQNEIKIQKSRSEKQTL